MQIMENRRLEGKGKILQKLRQNQEFLMSTTLSPQAKVWTRWHEDRALNNEMDKSLDRCNNHHYIQIIKDIVEPQFQPKLINWVARGGMAEKGKRGGETGGASSSASISEQNKKVRKPKPCQGAVVAVLTLVCLNWVTHFWDVC